MKFPSLKIFGSLAIAAALMGATSGQTVTIKGSEIMLPLQQRLAEAFMKKHPGIVIQVSGGGDQVGINAMLDGTADICAITHSMTPEQLAKQEARYKDEGETIRLAIDALSIYVNESNPIREMTKELLNDILSGKTTNWKQLGGPDSKISVYARDASSGTSDLFYVFSHNYYVDKPYTSNVQVLSNTAAIVNAVAKNKDGIGYAGSANLSGVRKLKVRSYANEPGCVPTPENIREYPLLRNLKIVTGKKPTGALKAYLDWVVSAEAKTVIIDAGFFPLGSNNRR